MVVEFVEAFRFLARTPGAGPVRQDIADDRPDSVLANERLPRALPPWNHTSADSVVGLFEIGMG